MDTLYSEFEAYLFQEKKMARNSLDAYRRDIRDFAAFIRERQIENPTEVNNAAVIAYILYLKKEGRTASTINRKIASVRAFYNFLIERGDIKDNPVLRVKTLKTEKSEPEYLSPAEVELLLQQPDSSLKGKRDRAILETIYATGMRVSEIVRMDIGDVNLKMGFAACCSEYGKGRVIPIGSVCRESIKEYLNEARNEIVGDRDEEALFVNSGGKRMTRQGLWKMIKFYAGKAGIEKHITPQILRHSCAIHMIQNGADLKSLQELLGHEDAAATQVYLMASKNRLKDVYDKTHPRA